jgi:predicted homoserine dehydrogenase-like protein
LPLALSRAQVLAWQAWPWEVQMALAIKLAARVAAGKPIRIAQIGAGKFGTMFLAQARLTPGLHVAGLADLDPARAASISSRPAGRPSSSKHPILRSPSQAAVRTSPTMRSG